MKSQLQSKECCKNFNLEKLEGKFLFILGKKKIQISLKRKLKITKGYI